MVPDTAPVITQSPSNLVVANRSPATLVCEAKGDPKPEITWFKDGKPVLVDSEDPDGRKLLMPQGSLYFLRIVHSKNKNKKSDLGNYHCEATNSAGSARSTEATIRLGCKCPTHALSLSSFKSLLLLKVHSIPF